MANEAVKKKVFGFINGQEPVGVIAVAMGEDGKFLAQHLSSSEGFAKQDLQRYPERYDEHFGKGNWEFEWVKQGTERDHAGLMAAVEIANAQGGDDDDEASE